MGRNLLKVILCIVLAFMLFYLIYVKTTPSSSSFYFHTSVFDNHEGEAIDWSYGVIIDAGSTGSRLFLYRWQSLSENHLIDIHPALDHINHAVVKKASPGLSAFANSPENATDYIKPLLDYAIQYVPVSKQSYTPVFIFATAGMRLLLAEQQEAILKNLRTNLPHITPMQIIPEHIRVIEGKWEGIYSWIAVNYILGRFHVNETNPIRQPTVGMIDIGGASLQIAIELSSSSEENKEQHNAAAVEIVNLGCRDSSNSFRYRLFATTFLGYGVNEGLRKYEQLLSDKLLLSSSSQNSSTGSKPYIRDSCLPKNLLKTVNRKNGSQFVRKGAGDWDNCLEELDKLVTDLGTNVECQKASCYLGQILAPHLSLSDIELYGFSECWFSTEDVFSLGGAYNFTAIAKTARDFCKLRWSTIQSRSRQKLYPKADEDRLRTQCFKSAWVAAILHTGFSLNKFSNKFRSIFDINGEEVQWTLGAMLYNMRYFPLRDLQRRNWLVKQHHRTAAAGIQSFPNYIYIFLIFILCLLIVILLWRRGTFLNLNKGLLRREPSIWGYMMLSPQDQLYQPSQYNKLHTFP